jgi:hypothetical protein
MAVPARVAIQTFHQPTNQPTNQPRRKVCFLKRDEKVRFWQRQKRAEGREREGNCDTRAGIGGVGSACDG